MKYAKLTNGIPEFSTEYKHFVQDESGAYVLRVKTAEDFLQEGYKPYRLIELENPDVYDYTQIVYSETPEEVIATVVGVMYTDEEKEAIAQEEKAMQEAQEQAEREKRMGMTASAKHIIDELQNKLGLDFDTHIAPMLEDKKTLVAFLGAEYIHRDDAMLLGVAQLLGLTEEQVDSLFVDFVRG